MHKVFFILLMIIVLTSGCMYPQYNNTKQTAEEPEVLSGLEEIDLFCDNELEYKNKNKYCSLLINLKEIHQKGIYNITFVSTHSVNLDRINLYGNKNYIVTKKCDYVINLNQNESPDYEKHEIYFEIKDNAVEYCLLADVYSLPPAPALKFKVSFSYMCESIIDPFPDYNQKREIELNKHVTGCFSRIINPVNGSDFFAFSNILQRNQFYKITVNFDLTNYILCLPAEHQRGIIFNNATPVAEYYSDLQYLAFFVVEDRYNASFSFSYFPGIWYNLYCETVDNVSLPEK